MLYSGLDVYFQYFHTLTLFRPRTQERRHCRFYPLSSTDMVYIGIKSVCRCRARGIWIYVGVVNKIGHTVDSRDIFTLWPYLGQERHHGCFYPLSSTDMVSIGIKSVCRCRARGIWIHVGVVNKIGHTVDSRYIFTLWPYLGQERRHGCFYPLSSTDMVSLGTQYVYRCRARGHLNVFWCCEQNRPYSGQDVY